MSRYSGLDKVDMSNIKPVETYQRVKIYLVEGHPQIGDGYAVVSRGFLVDEQFTALKFAKECVDHFLTD